MFHGPFHQKLVKWNNDRLWSIRGETWSLEKSFRKASFQKGPWLEPKMNCYTSCVFHETLSIWWYYCHLTTIFFFFFFLFWVQYWDILLSGETALIKYFIMNNVCKCVRHIFHKVKMNSFLVLPDVFVACRNNIWSEWQNKRIHPFIPVIWCSVPLYPLAVVTGLCSFHPAYKLFHFLSVYLENWKHGSWKLE